MMALTPIDTKPWLGKYRIPSEALRLSEDIQTLELILGLLGGLDVATISDDFATVRHLKILIHAAIRGAQHKLRSEYLAGKPLKVAQREKTVAQAWIQVIEDIRKVIENQGNKQEKQANN
jgi:hypothetical protein